MKTQEETRQFKCKLIYILVLLRVQNACKHRQLIQNKKSPWERPPQQPGHQAGWQPHRSWDTWCSNAPDGAVTESRMKHYMMLNPPFSLIIVRVLCWGALIIAWHASLPDKTHRRRTWKLDIDSSLGIKLESLEQHGINLFVCVLNFRA